MRDGGLRFPVLARHAALGDIVRAAVLATRIPIPVVATAPEAVDAVGPDSAKLCCFFSKKPARRNLLN